MSMFDREPNFEDTFKVGDRFVVTSLKYMGTINTRFGPAHRSTITIVTRDGYPRRSTYSVIGVGFKNLAERSSVTDFPVVVEFITVELPNNRSVKRIAPVTLNGEKLDPRTFVNGEDGDPIDMGEFAPNITADTPSGAMPDDDIPF